VEGKPINVWCDERRLDISQRIALLRSVCAAVRHAHQHLVVHRDLKPGNILVTPDGAVKLLDFGIAKLLKDAPAGAPSATETLAQMLTPDYASPEQINGGAITTLTDVYSLGVLSYELLTGHRPYRLRSSAMHELARVISEVEPLKPSAVVETGDHSITPDKVSGVREGDSAKLHNRLKGDLDCIVLTALQKEPARRYSSVEALDEDLRRHLEHRPVAAKSDSAWYRAERFIRRNPAAVIAALLIVLASQFGMAALVWQTRITLEASHGAPVGWFWFLPFWLISIGFLIGLAWAVVYFTRPGRKQIVAAAVGGTMWAFGCTTQYWVGYSFGWWRSRFPESPDPLKLFSFPLWILEAVVGAVLLLALRAIGFRYGWKGQAIFICLISFQGIRERVWFTMILPIMTADWGFPAILCSAAIYMIGLTLGLVIARQIGSDRSR